MVLSAEPPALGLAEGRGPAQAPVCQALPLYGPPLLFGAVHLPVHLAEASVAAHQKPKLYLRPLFAPMYPFSWVIFSWSSPLDQWFSAGSTFAPQGTS